MSVVNIKSDLTKIMNNSDIADVHFVVGPEKFHMYGHRIILSLNSKKFNERFYEQPTREGEIETERMLTIEVPEISSKAFQLFLEFFYTKEVDLTGEDVWSVLYISQKYEVYELIQICFNFILSMLSVKTIFEQLELSIECEQPFINQKILEFFDERASEILKKSSCLDRLNDHEVKTLLTRVAQGRTEPVPPILILRRIYERGQFLCKSKLIKLKSYPNEHLNFLHLTASADNILQEISHLLTFVRFEKMDLEALIEINKMALVSDQKMFSLLSNKYCSPHSNYSLLHTNTFGTHNKYENGNNETHNSLGSDLNNYRMNGHDQPLGGGMEVENLDDLNFKKSLYGGNRNNSLKKKSNKGAIIRKKKKKKKKKTKNSKAKEKNKKKSKKKNKTVRDEELKNYFAKFRFKKLVALLANDPCLEWRKDVEAAISKVARVTTFNLTEEVPLYEELEKFQAVFHYSTIPYREPEKIGNLLGRCILDGKGVVLTPCFATRTMKNNLTGLIGKLSLIPYIELKNELRKNPSGLGIVSNPNHRCVKNLKYFDGGETSYRYKKMSCGGRIIARWKDRVPLIVVTKRKKIGKFVFLNFLPISQKVWKRNDFKTNNYQNFPNKDHHFNSNDSYFDSDSEPNYLSDSDSDSNPNSSSSSSPNPDQKRKVGNGIVVENTANNANMETIENNKKMKASYWISKINSGKNYTGGELIIQNSIQYVLKNDQQKKKIWKQKYKKERIIQQKKDLMNIIRFEKARKKIINLEKKKIHGEKKFSHPLKKFKSNTYQKKKKKLTTYQKKKKN
ncbi:pep-cterm sorting domain-containing protein [Anaeramoeba flamelloides]|uniref:Pep-cterm sorting domain-containing protein n=1 Tax=Anaeramoeba flamelloides TaxID=1746091 RepID=A0AAV7ZIF9_9EUKA|nr:pep-cterm sorting domain-containing protein [Anaeramoeba flamelloides]